ncbi:MAG: T9SS type A sorting domain-containing protein [Bacteroidia bacterium]
MKNILLLTALLFLSFFTSAQLCFKPLDTLDTTIPHWARMMYGAQPNVYEVEKEYKEYVNLHPDDKRPYIGYYQNWRRYVQRFVQEDGSIVIPTEQEEQQSLQRARQAQQGSTANHAVWSFAGPKKNYRTRYNITDGVEPLSWHANMYCIDRSMTNPNVLYAGGENGGVYKTIDQGQNWFYTSLNDNMTTVSAVAVDPNNENIVLVNADNRTYRSTNGGSSWSPVSNAHLTNGSTQIWQFVYNPDNSQIVYAGAEDSLYRSTDGGVTWHGVYGGECMSIALNPLNSSEVFALRYNSISRIADFYKSTDNGITFNLKATGWFTVPPVDAGLIQSFGGRIAVTVADTSRLYVLLPGESQASAQLQLHGQIGVYRSDDGGETWSRPHTQIGSPYNASTHPNMMTFSGGDDTYNQIYYNTTLIASQLDADRILIGGMSMWRSDDAGATFQPVGGYIGSVASIHPDNQEFKVYLTSPTTEEVWFSSDGGINYSTDFVATHESRCNGVYGTALWGFDQGWNDDIKVGGRYHNGNAARRDGYPAGEFDAIGGGEAASGYVNYSNEKKVYFSDIDGRILPDTIHGVIGTFSMDKDPNELYIDNYSSRLFFDWEYWNVGYLGKDNVMYQSLDGGSRFSPFYTFGSNSGDILLWMEQSRANKDVFYVEQVVSNVIVLWKSTDHGVTFTQVTLPQSRREMRFTLSGDHQDELWICYDNGGNGNKVYHSVDGGQSWSNITTATLDGYTMKGIVHQMGTDGGVYVGTYHGPIYYRNNTMPDWAVVGSNLPVISDPLRIVPFYRDQKIRVATWDLGVWENLLYEPSRVIADFSADYAEYFCPGDTVSFVPHSVASSTAVYHWTFTGATPATTTDMYPKVVYNTNGSFDVKLVVTDGAMTDSITKSNFIFSVPAQPGYPAEDFEAGTFDPSWQLEGTGISPTGWAISDSIGGYLQSTHSMMFNNYGMDLQGAHDQIWTRKYDFTNLASGWLKFDVAYSVYGGQYSDSLQIDLSTDCGSTWHRLYLRGGTDLATAPSLTSAPFVPTATQWRTDSVDVTAYAGYTDVIFSIANCGNYGQVLYVDNINLSSIVLLDVKNEDLAKVSVYPNPVRSELKVEIDKQDEYLLRIYDSHASIVEEKKMGQAATLNVEKLGAGNYFYEIISAKGVVARGKFVRQ